LLPSLFFFISPHPPPRSTLFPYTTLFRSQPPGAAHRGAADHPARLRRGGDRLPDALGDDRSAALVHRHGALERQGGAARVISEGDRKSTRLNSSHSQISYAVFCLKKKKKN